ncbi:serine acetyltransferase [Pseudomonas asiatica]|uniref:serine O-acetyltransferase n=1 Tax=Pseudomonas asiatica TaxID=2219225 RepID=UPI002570A283|nr:serine acetyltransferase [Pseudomonas asiatica]WJD71551.1 serine acetyltransferase [Pseudomonas asiatica]
MNAIGIYRVANFCYQKKIPVVPFMCKAAIFLLFNSVVPYTTKIGKGSRFAYGCIGVVLHGRAVIGERVIIGQGVTVGRKLSPDGVPVIGNDVYIAAGARILGGITVGDNVIIGANSVVVTDVPANTIVAGAPARVVRTIDQSIYELLENIY